MPTSLTELLVVLGLGAFLVTSGIYASVAGRQQVEQAGRRQVGIYARYLDTEGRW